MSSVKERVLLIAERKGIAKEKFFSDLGLSYANFKGVQKKSGLNTDAVAIILSKYSDISPAWLLLGEGDMLRSPVIPYEIPAKPTGTTDIFEEKQSVEYETTFKGMTSAEQRHMVKDLVETVLKAQTEDIDILKQEVVNLKREIIALRNKIGE